MRTPPLPLVVFLMQANAGHHPGPARPRCQLPAWPETLGHDGLGPAPLPPGMGLRKCPATGLWLASPVPRHLHFAE